MPLPLISNLAVKYYSGTTYFYAFVAFLAVAIIRAYAQGRSTSRDRDLHGRVILLTGAFTSLGSNLLEALASRGAHVIALTSEPVSVESPATLIVEALRESTRNTNIFLEPCDTLSLASVRAFCTKFLTGKETRLDAIIFAHEYEHMGPIRLGLLKGTEDERKASEESRKRASDCTFLMTTLLLPTLLVAPAERDIRIINVINPFYAASIPNFPVPPPPRSSTFLLEGYRSLRSILFMRHLQRVLDALPQAPAPDPEKPNVKVVSGKAQKSNIVTVSVSPGFSRHDTVSPLIRAKPGSIGFSYLGMFFYILLQPLLRIFAKTPSNAAQTVLHALFLPTPFKFASATEASQNGARSSDPDDTPIVEALKPGALYSDCSVVMINLSKNLANLPVDKKADEKSEKAKGKEKENDDQTILVDDGEYGGEKMGRIIWEDFERSLKEGEALEKTEAEALQLSSSSEKQTSKKD